VNSDLRLSDEAGTMLRCGAMCRHLSRGWEIRAALAAGSGDLFDLAVGVSAGRLPGPQGGGPIVMPRQ
jgi:hypothetical protein